eukprot:Lithocolla_globosa_v1_NODE_6354_length_1096_cov_251.577181.p4 type:complete len:125 gc:universal NODE_6354_length_1096_cov_251.577181:66-440(+)
MSRSCWPTPTALFFFFWKDGKLVQPKSFEVEGVGKDSIPGALNMGIVDNMVRVTDKEAFTMCRYLSSSEAMLVGGSAGLNVAACVKLSEQIQGPATIVTVLPDAGLKYLSKIYSDDWMTAKGFL